MPGTRPGMTTEQESGNHNSWQSGLTDASLSLPARAMAWDGRTRWGWPAAAPRWWSTISAARAMAPAGRRRRPETVVEEIRKAGGTAMADGADVSNFEQVTAMVERATKEWGSVDLLCANAGILRDKSFTKMEVADFAKVLDVHLTGTFYCCKAVWAGMRERNYGRIVVTTSSSGLFGNFGQANYGAAKAGMIGLMNVLAEEGRKNNIRVNTISPTAATRMTEELLPPQALALMRPEAITPAVEFLLSEDAPTRTIMGAGAGSFAVIKIMETEGINLPQSDWTPDAVAAHFAEISDMGKAKALEGAFQQTQKYVEQAAARAGVKL